MSFQLLVLLKTVKVMILIMALPISTTLMIMILGMVAEHLPGHLIRLSALSISSMDGPDISAIVGDLPVPQAWDVSGMSVQKAVQVWHPTHTAKQMGIIYILIFGYLHRFMDIYIWISIYGYPYIDIHIQHLDIYMWKSCSRSGYLYIDI